MPCLCLRLAADRSETHLRSCGGFQGIGMNCNCWTKVFLIFVFQTFSKALKAAPVSRVRKFAIDLRSPEELEEEIKNDLDSEA